MNAEKIPNVDLYGGMSGKTYLDTAAAIRDLKYALILGNKNASVDKLLIYLKKARKNIESAEARLEKEAK